MKLPVLFLGLVALGGAAMCGSLAALALAAPPVPPPALSLVAPVQTIPPRGGADGWPFVPLLAMGGVALLLLQRRDEKHDDHQVAMRQARHRPAPHTEINRYAALPAPVAPPLLPGPEPAALPAPLPGQMTLGAVLSTGWRPSPEAILLGMGPGGARITVPIKAMLHLLLIGPTGIGKSTIERLIVPQLQAVGAQTHWWNPHYTPVDPDTGDDYRAMAAHTQEGRALIAPADILGALEQLITVDLPARKARWHVGEHPGPPQFFIIDEAPVLADDKRFMPWLGQILREGRKFGLFVIMATQDALISTLGGSSGIRAQAQTVYYGGGDRYSAKALLGFTPDDPPGRGLVLLKSAAGPGAPLIRVPQPQNADILTLLPMGANAVSPVSRPVSPVSRAHFRVITAETAPPEPEAGAEMDSIDPAKWAEVVRRLSLGEAYGAIVETVWGVKAGAGTGYKTAKDQMTAILADLARTRQA